MLARPAPAYDYAGTGAPPARVRGQRSALLLEGLGFERWGLREMLARQGLAIRESEFMKRRLATCVRYLPATLQEAQQFDLIVLGAVDAFALSHEGVAILKDYVRSGGSLLVLGGLYSYGGGRFQEFGLDEFLPLRVKRTFDLVQPKDRMAWEPAAWQSSGGVGTPPAPGRIAWAHDVDAAAEAAVWLRAGAQPLVAVCVAGRGRVAAVAATTLGDEAGEGAFWQREPWQQTLANLVQWLTAPTP
jgi:uncharacterized membrane protein